MYSTHGVMDTAIMVMVNNTMYSTLASEESVSTGGVWLLQWPNVSVTQFRDTDFYHWDVQVESTTIALYIASTLMSKHGGIVLAS